MTTPPIDPDDEIVMVTLPRKDYEVMRQLIKERETMNNITAVIQASWIWIVVSGAVGLYFVWDKIKASLGAV